MAGFTRNNFNTRVLIYRAIKFIYFSGHRTNEHIYSDDNVISFLNAFFFLLFFFIFLDDGKIFYLVNFRRAHTHTLINHTPIVSHNNRDFSAWIYDNTRQNEKHFNRMAQFLIVIIRV